MKIYVPQVELVRIDPFPPLIKIIEWFCFLKYTYNIALTTKENRKRGGKVELDPITWSELKGKYAIWTRIFWLVVGSTHIATIYIWQ